MDPSLSMNTMSGHVDLNELERRAKVHAAQRAAYDAQRRENEAAARAELQALQAEVGHNQRAVMQNAAYDSADVLRMVAGAALDNGATVQRRAPGKTFSRSDILAILKSQHALALQETATGEWKAAKNSAFRDLLTIFENLE